MQQFIQFSRNFQQQFADSLSKHQDSLCIVPSGINWLDLVSNNGFERSKSLTVVIYPNHSLLKQQVEHLRNFDLKKNYIEALTSDMPPNEVRSIWRDVENRQISFLLMTAKHFQSLSTLGQLIRNEDLTRIILIQGELVIPHLWGPFFDNPYLQLADLLKTRWQNRPVLNVICQPLSSHYMELISSIFELRTPQKLESDLYLDRIKVSVKRCITGYHKLRHLKHFIQAENLSNQHRGVLIVCQSVKDINFLEKRLSPIVTLSWHGGIDNEAKKICILESLHRQNWVILIESRSLAEFPMHMLPVKNLNTVHWKIPWSMEALTQQLILSINPNTESISNMVLYSKEDYFSHKKLIALKLSEQSSSKPAVYMDNLNQLRYFCALSRNCHLMQIKDRLNSDKYDKIYCGICDNCKNMESSSLWRNLLDPFIY